MIKQGLTICTLTLALAGCGDLTTEPYGPRPPQVTRVYRGSANVMDVWRDRDTGCEYISYVSNAGLTPRLDADGMPVCKASITQKDN